MRSYRPLLPWSVFAKIFESCSLYTLRSPPTNNSNTKSKQYRFIFATVAVSMEACDCPVGVLCDQSGAFDCVNHNKLIAKLLSYGPQENPSAWNPFFLTNRRQY